MEEQGQASSNKMMLYGGVLLLVVIAAGVYYFYSMSKKATSPDQMSQGDQVSTQPAASSAVNVESSTSAVMGAVKEFTVSGTNFKFTPATLSVNKGDKVRITFKNTGGTHDFAIDEFNAKSKTINGGTEDVLEFTANKAGIFEYYCSVGKHREMGMKGTLMVQ